MYLTSLVIIGWSLDMLIDIDSAYHLKIHTHLMDVNH